MSILNDLSVLATVIKEVDAFIGTLPATDEMKAIKMRLDQALKVLTVLEL